MKNNILIALFLIFFGVTTYSQVQGCATTRYIADVATGFKKTIVTYGSNINQGGATQSLDMNVYEPITDNITKRPVIVFAHGGSFMFGAKEDLDSVSILFAKKGYVCATINYRLFPLGILGFPSSDQILDQSVMGMQDAKAAIRFFRKDAATSNTFKVDPNNIILGGYSAGAIIALQGGFLDSTDVITTNVSNAIKTNGGLEGKSGNPGYSSEVVAIMNMSGGVIDPAIIDKNDPPFISMHGTTDNTVFIDYGLAGGLVNLYGSDRIVAKANQISVPNYYERIVGGGHVDIYTSAAFLPQFNNFLINGASFIKKVICKLPLASFDPRKCECAKDMKLMAIYPNPAQCYYNIIFDQSTPNMDIIIYDIKGSVIQTQYNISEKTIQTFTDDMENGTYFIKVSSHSNPDLYEMKKLVIQK